MRCLRGPEPDEQDRDLPVTQPPRTTEIRKLGDLDGRDKLDTHTKSVDDGVGEQDDQAKAKSPQDECGDHREYLMGVEFHGGFLVSDLGPGREWNGRCISVRRRRTHRVALALLRLASAPANDRQRKSSESRKKKVFCGASSCAEVRIGYGFDDGLAVWIRDFKAPATENCARLSSLLPQ